MGSTRRRLHSSAGRKRSLELDVTTAYYSRRARSFLGNRVVADPRFQQLSGRRAGNGVADSLRRHDAPGEDCRGQPNSYRMVGRDRRGAAGCGSLACAVSVVDSGMDAFVSKGLGQRPRPAAPSEGRLLHALCVALGRAPLKLTDTYSAASLWPSRALSLWINSSAASEITVPGGKIASAPAL